MSNIPVLKPQEVVSILENLGFVEVLDIPPLPTGARIP